MPSKTFQCDFCDIQQRKADLPHHIKTKHTLELAKYLVEDAKESNISVISSYMRNANPLTMPIPSRVHPNTDYWFGVRPIMIEEKDSVSPYMAVEANLDAHVAFLRELMENVSLNDFMGIQRTIIIRSPEMIYMKDRVSTVEKELCNMTDDHKKELYTMTTTLEAYRKTVEEINDGVLNSDLRIQVQKAERAQKSAECQATKALEHVSTLQWKYKELEKRYDESHQSNTETSGIRILEMEQAYMKRIEALQIALGKERDKVSVAKKSTKESDKKTAERERLKKEMKEAKKRMKALELSDSDSDSDSD
jgi:predicted  nucleic acid-binding Zn-ribbon protein